jgi:3-hydroxyisobutyrate dehydrogenase-like beta-hydroxyacid dehydrogenase
MGQRMAKRLASANIELQVWSRSGVRLEAPGVRQAATIHEAVADATVVVSMVRDDEASRGVWLGAGGALSIVRPGTALVECSTLSPAWVRELSEAASGRGARLLDAPVVGSRPQAEAGALVFLAGGAREDVERVRPLLGRMGAATHFLGASPAGSYAKLMVNALFGVQVAAMAELLGFADKAHVDRDLLMQALDGLPVLSAAAKGAAAGMMAHRFEPMFPVALAAKDFRYVVRAAAELGSNLPLARGLASVFEEACAAGLENENLTAVAKLYAEERPREPGQRAGLGPSSAGPHR